MKFYIRYKIYIINYLIIQNMKYKLSKEILISIAEYIYNNKHKNEEELIVNFYRIIIYLLDGKNEKKETDKLQLIKTINNLYDTNKHPKYTIINIKTNLLVDNSFIINAYDDIIDSDDDNIFIDTDEE